MPPRVRPLTPNAIRLTHPADAADRPWLKDVLLPLSPVAADAMQLRVEVSSGLARVQTLTGETLVAEARAPVLGQRRRPLAATLDIPKTEIKIARRTVDEGVSLAFTLQPGEGFYGWGEWFNAFRRERGTVNLKTRDAIALIQNRETYSALPFFISSRGYGVLLLNSHASAWHLRPELGELQIEADGPGADYIVIYGPAYRDIVQTYTALTGRPPLIPRWAFGLFVTGYPQEAQAVITERVQEHRRRAIPLDSVILDYHWEQGFHNFKWRASIVPDPEGFIAQLKRLNTRLGLILTPFVNHRSRPFQKWLLHTLASNQPEKSAQNDERALPEYAEARAAGHFAHPDAKWWFGAGGMMDFTSQAASKWWNDKLRPLYEQGIAFFKNDDGEYLPDDAQTAIGLDGREAHNLYGFYYSRAMYEGMAALDDRRPFVYARSAWLGSQRFPAIFLGDQHPTFEYLQSTLRAGLNMGLLGFAYWTADVFGLDGKTTPETHMRYAQWALLNPVARYFWRPPAIDDTRFPWSHNAEVEANFKTYAELRYRLLPYFYELAWDAYRTGLPMVRPLMLEFQEDARFADTWDQVLLGERVLLAPITSAGATTRTVLLPHGRWHDFWTPTSWEGGGATDYPAPLNRLPLLIRGGTILPLGPALMHIPDDHRFGQIDLHLWPPYAGTCTLYDDDGLTRAYQHGECATTRVEALTDKNRTTITLHASAGNSMHAPTIREWNIRLERAAEPKVVRVNGVGQVGQYNPASGQLLISLSAPTAEMMVVEIEW